MTSTTSGLTAFTLDVDDIIEQALEPVGGDYTNANDQSKARRALNLILIELQNKNIPLNKIGVESVALIDGTQEYTLSSSINDILEGTLKNVSDTAESTLDRWGLKEFHQVSDKTQEGRPTLFVTDREASAVKVKLWPVPDTTSKWTAEFLVNKRIEDVTASYQKIDLSYRYMPLLVSWLSYKLSLNTSGIDPVTKQNLQLEYKEIMMDTFNEDRERTDFFLTPGGISGT